MENTQAETIKAGTWGYAAAYIAALLLAALLAMMAEAARTETGTAAQWASDTTWINWKLKQ